MASAVTRQTITRVLREEWCHGWFATSATPAWCWTLSGYGAGGDIDGFSLRSCVAKPLGRSSLWQRMTIGSNVRDDEPYVAVCTMSVKGYA